MKRFLFALPLLALACKSSIPSWLSTPPPTTQEGVEVVVTGVLRGTTWISGIVGEATNVSGGPLSRCKVSFDAYDIHGSLLATARAERDGLDVGETWDFKATFARDVDNAHAISAARVIAIP